MGCWNFVKKHACYLRLDQFPLAPCFSDLLQMRTTRWPARPAAWFSPTLIRLRKGRQWMCPTRQGSSTRPSAWQICFSTSPRWNVLRATASRRNMRWDNAFIFLSFFLCFLSFFLQSSLIYSFTLPFFGSFSSYPVSPIWLLCMECVNVFSISLIDFSWALNMKKAQIYVIALSDCVITPLPQRCVHAPAVCWLHATLLSSLRPKDKNLFNYLATPELSWWKN